MTEHSFKKNTSYHFEQKNSVTLVKIQNRMKILLSLILALSLFSCRKDEQPIAQEPDINCSCGTIDSLTSGLGVWRIHVSNDCSGNSLTTTLSQDQWLNTGTGDQWCNDGGQW